MRTLDERKNKRIVSLPKFDLSDQAFFVLLSNLLACWDESSGRNIKFFTIERFIFYIQI